ncbi:MAG: hypothetical protein IKF98_09265, partial [Clostridia bacterium]|nr:hypothetical protein [Clostridia bacterium]
MGLNISGNCYIIGNWKTYANSDLSRACARLKGDRSPFNTSSSDLPEIAGDFRAANLQGSLFCSGR